MNIWLLWVLVAALVIFSCYTWDLSSLTRDQTQALFWECRVLATGPAGASPCLGHSNTCLGHCFVNWMRKHVESISGICRSSINGPSLLFLPLPLHPLPPPPLDEVTVLRSCGPGGELQRLPVGRTLLPDPRVAVTAPEAWARAQPVIEWFLDSNGLSLLALSRQEAWVKPDQVHSFVFHPGMMEGLRPEPTQDPGRAPPPTSSHLALILVLEKPHCPSLSSPKRPPREISKDSILEQFPPRYRCFKGQIWMCWERFPLQS